jgi:hypothetical protein
MKPSALLEALHALISQRVPLHIWGAEANCPVSLQASLPMPTSPGPYARRS